jgi:exopolysaccharide production protein ExoZ
MSPDGTSEARLAAAPDSRQLTSIQAARGLAAIAVVLSHAGTILGSPAVLSYVPMLGIFRFGHAGVDFFFVLSGFIIVFVHHRHIGRPDVFMSYLRKRLTRIFPMYWVALGLLMILTALGMASDVDLSVAPTDAAQLVRTLLLLPQHQSSLLGVSWTLQHEMLFYLLFGLAILDRRLGVVALGVWLGTVIWACLWVTPDPLPWAPVSLLWGFFAASYHLQFLLGGTVAIGVLNGSVPAPRMILLLGILGLASTGVLEDAGLIAYLGPASQALFGGFSALAIAGMAAGEQIGLLASGARPAFVGESSYSIYLVHAPVIAAATALLAAGRWTHVVPGWLLMVVLVMIGGTAGLVIHLVVERPILRLLRGARFPRWLPQRSTDWCVIGPTEEAPQSPRNDGKG